MLIDMHAHVIPESFPIRETNPQWPSMDHFEAGRAKVMIAGKLYRTVHSGNWDFERRLSDMEAAGVDAEVISPMPELLAYWYDQDDGLDFCRYLNNFIRRLCDSAPDRFWGLGAVPLQNPELATNELTAIKALGLSGVELGTHVNGRSLGMPEFQAFFAEAKRLGLSVFVHALRPTMQDRFPTPSITNPIGFPIENALAIASLINGGIAEACPDLRLAFSHGGGGFPFMLPRYSHAWDGAWNEEQPEPPPPAANSQGLARSPAEYARRFYYDTLLFDHRAIRYLIEIIGHSQLMVGSDYPYMQREEPVGRTPRSMGLSDEIVEDISSRNCLRFLGLERQ